MGAFLLHAISAEHAMHMIFLRTVSINLNSSFVALTSAARTLNIAANIFSWHTQLIQTEHLRNKKQRSQDCLANEGSSLPVLVAICSMLTTS